VNHFYLGDKDEIEKATSSVAAQAQTKQGQA